ncbi:MAG: hypothetical protein IPL79_12540 [Myxococcales bacterium]|nr:hypothetical protein [Myxococcales bacterium]
MAAAQSVALIDSIELTRPAPTPRTWTTRACAGAFAALTSQVMAGEREQISALHDRMEALAAAVDALNEALVVGAATDANAQAIVAAATSVSEALRLLLAARTAATAAGKLAQAATLTREIAVLGRQKKTKTIAYHDATIALARLHLDASIDARDAAAVSKHLRLLATGRDRLARMVRGDVARAAYVKALRELHAAASALAPTWTPHDLEAYEAAARHAQAMTPTH